MTKVNSKEYSFIVLNDQHGNKALTVIKGHPDIHSFTAKSITEPDFYSTDAAQLLKKVVDAIQVD